MEYATLLCLVVAVGLAAARGRALVVLLLAWRGRRSGKRKDDDVESNRRRPPRPQAAAFLSFRRPGGGAGAAAGGSGREADEENGSPAPSPRTLSFEWPRRSEETHAATGSDDTGSAVSNTSDAVLSWKPAHEREAVGVAGSHATRHRPGGVETAACERPERAKPAARETEDLPGQSVRPVLSFEWPRHSEESHTAAGSDDTGSAVSNSSDSVLSWKPSRERDAVRVAGSRDADTAVSNDADSVLSSKQPPCKRGGAHAAGTTHSSNNPAPVFSCEPLRIAGSREGDDARGPRTPQSGSAASVLPGDGFHRSRTRRGHERAAPGSPSSTPSSIACVAAAQHRHHSCSGASSASLENQAGPSADWKDAKECHYTDDRTPAHRVLLIQRDQTHSSTSTPATAPYVVTSVAAAQHRHHSCSGASSTPLENQAGPSADRQDAKEYTDDRTPTHRVLTQRDQTQSSTSTPATAPLIGVAAAQHRNHSCSEASSVSLENEAGPSAERQADTKECHNTDDRTPTHQVLTQRDRTQAHTSTPATAPYVLTGVPAAQHRQNSCSGASSSASLENHAELSADRRDAKESRGTDDRPTPPHRGGGLTQRDRKQAGSTPATLCGTPAFAPFAKGTPLPPGTPASAQDSPLILPLPCSRFSTPTFAPADPVASPSSRLLPAASLYLPMPDAALAAGQPGRAADGWARPRAMRSRPGFDVSNLLPLDVSGASLHLFPPSPAGAAPGAAAGATPGRLDSSRSSLHLCPPSPADATPCATGRVSGQLDSSRSSLHLCPPSPADGAATGGASGQLDSSLTSLHLCPPSPADATLGTAAGAAPGQLDSSLASLHLYCPSSADATPGATTPGQLDPSRASLHLRPLSPAGAAGHHAAPGTATSVPHSTQASLPPYPPSPAAEATGRHVTPSMPTSTTRGPLNLYPPSPVCTAGHHATPSTATSIPFSSQTSLRAHPASPAGAAGHQSSLVTSGYLGRVQKAKVASSTSPEVLGSPPGLQRLCPAGSGSADGGGHGPGACANANHFTTISYHKPVASLPSVPSSPHPSHAASKHPPCAVDSLPIDPSDLRTSWKRFHCTSSSPCHVPGGQSHGLCAQPDPTYRDPLWSDCSNLPSSVPGSPLHAPLAPRARNAASGHTCLMNASSPRHGPAGLHDPPLWRCSIMPHSVPSSPFHGPAGSRLQGSAHASDAPAHAFCRGVPSWLGVSCSVPSSPCHTFAAPSPREIAHHFKSPASVPSTPHHTFGKLDAAAVPHALACFSSMPSSVPSSPSHTLTAPSPRGDQRAPLEISHYARAPFPPLSSSLPSTPHHASGRHDAASAPHTLACFSNMPSSVPSSPCHMARTRGALACKPAASVPNSPCNASTTPTAVCATTYSFCLAQHTLTTLTNGEHATESLLSNVGVAFRTFDKPDKPGLSGWSSVPGSPCAGATRGRTHDHLAASTAAAAVAPGDQCQPQAPADMPQASSRLPSYNSGANAGRFHDNSAPASASASQQNGGGGFLQASPSVPSFPCPGAMAGRVHDALGVSSSFPSSSASQRRPQAQNQIVGGPGPLQAPPSVPISPCTRAPAAAAHQQKCAAGVAPCEVKQPAAVDAEDGPPMQAQVVVRHRGGPGPGMPAVSPKENGLDSLSLHACAWDAVWKATAASSLAPLPSFSPASRTLVLAVPSPSHTGRRGFDSRLFGSPGAFPSSSLPPSRRSSEAGTPGGGLPGVDPPAGELGGLAAFSLCPPAIPLAAPPPAPGHRRWSRPQLLPSSGSISCCAGPPRAGLPPAGALCGSSGRQPRLPAGGPFAGQSGSSHSSHTVVEPPAERPCSGQLGSSPLSHTVVEPVEIPVSGQSGSSPSSHTVVEPPAERPFSGPSGSSLPSGTVVDQPPERPFPGSSGGSPSSHAVVEPPAGSPPSGSPSSRAPPPSETRPPSFSHSLAPTAAPGSPASPHTSEPQVSPDGPGAQTSPSASPAAGPREGLQPSVSPLTPCPLSCLSMDHPSLNSPQSSVSTAGAQECPLEPPQSSLSSLGPCPLPRVQPLYEPPRAPQSSVSHVPAAHVTHLPLAPPESPVSPMAASPSLLGPAPLSREQPSYEAAHASLDPSRSSVSTAVTHAPHAFSESPVSPTAASPSLLAPCPLASLSREQPPFEVVYAPQSSVPTRDDDTLHSSVSTRDDGPLHSSVPTRDDDPSHSSAPTRDDDPLPSSVPMRDGVPLHSSVPTRDDDPSPSSASTSAKSVGPPAPQPGAPAAETRWKYGNLLGSGAFGQVYVAMDASQGTLAAVKIVSFAYGGDPDALRKRLQGLKTEIDVMKHLRHPNIVRYLDTERRGHSLHIFMEYVPGGSIADNITRFGSLSQPVVVAYTGQVLEGLAYLHSKRVVHRDIKGANILLAVDGSCKLGDFGAATLMGTDPHKSVVGTMNWMPPEVITGQCHSLTCDVWSLGCTVLEMLTADLPWAHVRPAGAPRKKPTTLQVVTHVVSCADYGPGLLACLAGLCSPAGAAFVLACLRKEPATRPTVAELIRHPWMRERGGGVPLARGPARGESGAPGCGLLSRENDDLRRLREKEEGGGLLLLQEKEKLLSEEGKASDNLLLRENDDLCRLREKKEGGSLLFPEKEKLVSEEEEAGDALLLRENENLPSQTKEAGSNLPLQKTEEGSNLRLLSNEDESVPGSPSSQEEEGKLLATGSPPMRERIEKVPLDRRGEPGVSLQEEVDDLAAGSPSLREDKEGSAPETEDSAVPEGPARGFTVQPQPQKSDEDCSGDRRAAGAPPGESAAAHRDSRWDAPARGAQRNRSARGGAWVPPKIKVRPFGLRNANTAPRRAASMKE